MDKRIASDRKAESLRDKPLGQIQGHDISWDGKGVIIYDDVRLAEAMARELGTSVKHANAKHKNSSWQTFSIVRLAESSNG